MTEDKSQENLDEVQNRKIKFDYIKSNYFRVIHVDGVSGGITPNFDIHVAFWNERPPIPKHVEYEVLSNGEVIEKIDGTEAIVREVEVSMILNAETAQIIIEWLQNQLEEIHEYTDEEEEEHEEQVEAEHE